MSSVTLNCNECGALIEAPSIARYVTCNGCGAHLVVHRTGAATYTESTPQAAADLSAPALGDVSQRLEQLEWQNELARIDREWQMEREQYMVTSRYGQRYVPSTAAAIVVGVLAVGFGLFWTIMAFGMAASSGLDSFVMVFPLFGLVFIVGGLALSIFQYGKAQRYQAAQAQYEDRRAKAVDDMHRMKE